jgi:hypothetical protein
VVKKIGLLSAGIGLLVAAFGSASCEAITGLDKDYHLSGTGGGAGGTGGATTTSGGTGGATGGTGGVTGCVHATVPDPPAVADDGGAIEFVSAMRSINLDEKDFAVTLGLDLDGVCTCEGGAPPTCDQPAGPLCDGPGGIDNAVGIIFATVYDLSSNVISSGQLSSAANNGQWTNLVRVRGYNGLPDDAKVSAMIYLTQGVNAGMPKPVWDGTDAWPIDDTSLADPQNTDSGLIQTTDGYVAGGVLVLRIPSEPLRIRGPLFTMDLELTDVIVRAKLVADGASYKLTDGVIGGRWTLADAFPGLASIRYAGGNKLCTNDNNYVGVKSALCGDADLRQDGMAGACDALSFGATFTADPAKLGGVVPAAGPPADGCAVDKDPAADKCN